MKGISGCQSGLRGKTGQHCVDNPALFSKDAVEVVLTQPAFTLPKLYIMGCMKSKQTFPFPTTLDIERVHESEEAFIPEESFQHTVPSLSQPQVQEEVKKHPEPANMVLEYAEHLAKEIVQDALKQWACENIKYSNIPFIESEGSDTAIG